MAALSESLNNYKQYEHEDMRRKFIDRMQAEEKHIHHQIHSSRKVKSAEDAAARSQELGLDERKDAYMDNLRTLDRKWEEYEQGIVSM